MRYAVILAAVLASTPAWAQPPTIPRYDPDRYCRQVQAATGFHSATVMRGCIESERDSLNLLRIRWPGLTDQVRDACDHQVRANDRRSYAALQGCVETEEATAAAMGRRLVSPL
ncbi:MAG TPA: hypothetical protein VGM87_14680 [Roseomonas sp.]|jgi:hypothetical protein